MSTWSKRKRKTKWIFLLAGDLSVIEWVACKLGIMCQCLVIEKEGERVRRREEMQGEKREKRRKKRD